MLLVVGGEPKTLDDPSPYICRWLVADDAALSHAPCGSASVRNDRTYWPVGLNPMSPSPVSCRDHMRYIDPRHHKDRIHKVPRSGFRTWFRYSALKSLRARGGLDWCHDLLGLGRHYSQIRRPSFLQMSRLLLAGATGYIGGQVLGDIISRHPSLSITAIIRNEQKAAIVRKTFPTVRVVLADLNDAETLKWEASQASIVLQLASSSHIQATKAIHEGLKQRQSGDPVYWVQISGARLLAMEELSSPDFVPGLASSKIFDDLSGLPEIVDLVREFPSRAVDNYILDVAAEHSSIRTALVIPPLIYGKGQGPVNTRSFQVPELCRLTLLRGHGVMVGEGLNRWGNIHIRDVSRLFGAIVDAAINRSSSDILWGENGVYLAGVGEMTFQDIVVRIVTEARKLNYIQEDQMEKLDKATIDNLLPFGSALLGTNSRGKGNRATELLNWRPSEQPLEDDIARAVREEADRLQMHA
ncbi:hypothetical protein HIM_08243 [Hirsutella minnesotensis 3608]|uniref:NAD(P)-binding domain-containing protein n=1 Tax=Hirsutella minnesotensis 3608 TaxID=1043627 RepID=A0A0F7ZYE2_9HYPO|nr:hypothetical protein HIM_08243 [Hirsutella minnesotensis 3608]